MAKKKSPAELKEEGIALGEKINAARKKPYNFALSMGKDSLVLETHLNKTPDVLWRTAKKNGGGPKGAMGTMSVKGKIIELTCVDDSAPGSLSKLAKKFFAERGQPYKVVLITPSGEMKDDADEDEAPKAAPKMKVAEKAEAPTAAKPKTKLEPEADTPPAKETNKKPALVKAFGTLKPEVLGLMKIANPEQRGQLQSLMKSFGVDLGKGQFEQSEATLSQLRASLDDIKTKRAEGATSRMAELAGVRARNDALMARLRAMRESRGAS